MTCEICGDARWVCEDHVDKPWVAPVSVKMPATAAVPGCRAACNQTQGIEPPEMPPGYRSIIDKEDGWTN